MNILITGGTGLVGSRLTELLLQKGHHIAYLSRGNKSIPNVKTFQWNVNKQTIDKEAITWADCVVNLAGAGVADKAWTADYKKEIYDSRVMGTKLLAQTLSDTPNRVKSFIQASAIGIYGLDTKETLLHETSPLGKDFLATVTTDWEHETQKINDLGLRTAILRIGIVLSAKGGALQKLALPIKLFAGAAVGTGQQYLSWIHIDDLCKMFINCIEDATYHGIYNAVAPQPLTNAQLTQHIAKALKRPLFLPNVPAFVLKMGMGEMANIVLGGNKVSSKKIENAGFQFKFADIDVALHNLMM
jgi:uncharacterized protein (TIGR01777 family)